MNLFVSFLGSSLGMMFFRHIKNRKKDTESNTLLKINELEAITANQHFFYGSLNSIKQYLFSHSQMEAAQYLTKFSKLLKTISVYSKQNKITLAEELEITLLYLELEQKRLINKLEFFYEIEDFLHIDKINIAPLLIFKKIETLIDNRNNENVAIRLIIREFGKKLECVVKKEEASSYVFVVNVPKGIN